MSMTGRTVLVTGAAHNLGRSIATHLARERAVVIAHARTEADAERAAREIGADTGAVVVPVAFDLGDPAAIDSGFDLLEDGGLLVDGLVLNAAHLGLRDQPTLEQPLEFLDEVLAVNVSGVYRCCMQVARRLVAADRAGDFVVVSSLAGEQAIHGRLAYNTSKAAVDGLVRSLAIDLAPHRIRVNGIAPGFVWSDRWESIGEEEARSRRALIPIGRETAQAEIARLAAFLVSDATPSLTGERIVIDGGLAAQQAPPPAAT
ncbi:SDR family NAD(P)-dependent oxidoreductase [Microbacterium tumbae]